MINKFFKYTKDNLSLESVNKFLLFLALASLFIRSGNFDNTLIPKPFEIIFSILVFLTAIDVIKNKRIREFYNSVPRNIWLAVIGLVFSILIGWSITLFAKKIPLNYEMALEFGRLAIAVATFLLIFFYSGKDNLIIKKYFYALLSSVVYIVFLFVPNILADSLVTTAGRFTGFTNNVNTISKLLLVPAMFFAAYSLFEKKNKLIKIIYIIVSAGAVALLIWTSSRGALLSLLLGLLFVFFIFIIENISRKKFLDGGLVIIAILFLGFLLTPYSGKQNFLNRSLNADTSQVHYYGIKDKSLKEIVENSFKNNDATTVIDNGSNGINNSIAIYDIKDKDTKTASGATSETRMTIWWYSIKQIPKNILGLGPAYNLSYSGTPLSGGTHNSYLQVFFEGGIIAILSFGYILLRVVQNLKNELEYNFSKFTIAVSASLFSLLIALMFDANVKLFWFWVILAIAINIKSTNIINNNE